MLRSATAAAVIAIAASRPAYADPHPVRVRLDVTSPTATAPAQVRVDAGARVVLEITKNTFQACTVAAKVEALPPSANPASQILAILAGIPGIPTALRVEPPAAAPPAPREFEPVQHQLDHLADDVTGLNADLARQLGEIRERAASLPRWAACDQTRVCLDPEAASTKLEALADALQRTPSGPIGSVTVAAARTAELLKTLDAALDRPSDDDGVWLHWAFERLRAIQELIDTAGERRQLAMKGRDALQAVRERILTFQPAVRVDEPLAAQTNANSVITITCTNVVTQQPSVYRLDGREQLHAAAVPPVTTTIVYRSAPGATVSAGVLYSLVDRAKIVISPHRLGSDRGVLTYERRIVEADRSASQVVPFSFVNLIVPGLRQRRVAPAASLGVGLNPNNGSTVVEYFAGGALAIGHVAVQFGAHFGSRIQPAEAFAIGDVLPDRLATVPTTRSRAKAFALGLSYAVGVK